LAENAATAGLTPPAVTPASARFNVARDAGPAPAAISSAQRSSAVRSTAVDRRM